MSEPPGISREDIQAVRLARLAIQQADQGPFKDAPSVVLLRNLLTAYDVLGGRLAWLAAEHGQLMQDFAAVRGELQRMNGDE